MPQPRGSPRRPGCGGRLRRFRGPRRPRPLHREAAGCRDPRQRRGGHADRPASAARGCGHRPDAGRQRHRHDPDLQGGGPADVPATPGRHRELVFRHGRPRVPRPVRLRRHQGLHRDLHPRHCHGIRQEGVALQLRRTGQHRQRLAAEAHHLDGQRHPARRQRQREIRHPRGRRRRRRLPLLRREPLHQRRRPARGYWVGL